MDRRATEIYKTLKTSKTHKKFSTILALRGMSSEQIDSKLRKLSEYLSTHMWSDWSLSYAGVYGLTMPNGFKPTDPTDETLPEYIDTGDEAVMPSGYVN